MMPDNSPIGTDYKTKSRKHYQRLDAVDPHDGKKWDVLIAPGKIESVKRRGMGAVKEMVFTVPDGLVNIKHLYRGVRDVDRDLSEDDWLCYISKPSRAYDYKTDRDVPAWENEVFLIYVNDEREVYIWFWVECDPNEPFLPKDYKTRFIEKVF